MLRVASSYIWNANLWQIFIRNMIIRLMGALEAWTLEELVLREQTTDPLKGRDVRAAAAVCAPVILVTSLCDSAQLCHDLLPDLAWQFSTLDPWQISRPRACLPTLVDPRQNSKSISTQNWHGYRNPFCPSINSEWYTQFNRTAFRFTCFDNMYVTVPISSDNRYFYLFSLKIEKGS